MNIYSINAEQTLPIRLPWFFREGRYKTLFSMITIALYIMLPVIAYELNIALTIWRAIAMMIGVILVIGLVKAAFDIAVEHRVRHTIKNAGYDITKIDIAPIKENPFHYRNYLFVMQTQKDGHTSTQYVLLQHAALYVGTPQNEDA